MVARAYTQPVEWVSPEGAWPAGPFSDDTPAHVVLVARLVKNTTEAAAAQGYTLRALAQACGSVEGRVVSHSSLSRLTAGKVIPDLPTVVQLETVLGPLWPQGGSSHLASPSAAVD